MVIKLLKLISVIPVILMLASCIGAEPDNEAYITAMGIDKTDNGFLYTIQFAQPTKISGGANEEGGSGGNIVENITVEAPTIYSAINVADTIISKDLSLSHAKVFVISEEVAANGLNGINDVIMRNNDVRPDMYLSVTEDAGKYLEEVKPSIELNPVKYYQLTYENKNGSAIPQNTALDFYSACISGTKDCILPLAGVAETEEDGSEKSAMEERKSIENISQEDAVVNEGGFERGTRNYYAGQTGKRIKNKSEVLGSAVFKGDKYIGKLGTTETELHNILMNHFGVMNINFYTNADPDKPITLRVEEKSHPRYKIDMDRKTVDIYVGLQGELLSVPEEHKQYQTIAETDESASQMVDTAAEEFIDKVYNEMNADVLGIKGRLKSKFLTIDEYNRYCESFNPSDWEFDVHADVKINRTGMTYYY